MPTKLLLCALLLVTNAAHATPPEAFLVADLASGQENGDAFPHPGGDLHLGFRPVEFEDRLYFAADHPLWGVELWSTDGTTGGTSLVADHCPGPCDSKPDGAIVFDGRIFFTAEHPVLGRELFALIPERRRVDLFLDLCEGACSGFSAVRHPGGRLPILPNPMVVFGDRLAFVGDDGTSGKELWITDGRPTATRVTDLCPGPCDALPKSLVATSERLFFLARLSADFSSTRETYWAVATDGSPEGTEILRRGEDLERMGEEVFIQSPDPGQESSLFKSDGTEAGTVRLPVSQVVALLGSFAGRLYFNAGALGAGGFALWASDGSAAGTELVLPRGPAAFAAGREAFFVFTREADETTLWLGDGSPDGFLQLARGMPRFPENVLISGDRLFFSDIRRLFTSDGTAAGTGPVQSFTSQLENMVAFDDRVLFVATESTAGRELWASDGTAPGTALLRDLHRGQASSKPRGLASVGPEGDDRLIFTVDRESGTVLMASDGSAEGTVELGVGPVAPNDFLVPGDGEIFYCPGRERHRPERAGLWSSDGTPVGTRRRLADFISCGEFLPFDGGYLFAAIRISEEVGEELWFTDLTSEGTRLVKNINLRFIPIAPPQEDGSQPRDFEALGDQALFSAESEGAGRELWVSDGTTDGTWLVRDVCAGDCSGAPAELTPLGDLVLFSAGDEERGREPWASDGTRRGTRRLIDLQPGQAGSDPRGFVRIGGEIFFFARRGRGDRLWTFDGTRVRHVKNLAMAGQPSHVGEVEQVGERLFFTVFHRRTGSELWTSDGTAAGTRLLKQIAPGRRGARPGQLTAIDGALVFTAADRSSGAEPWISDGTAAGPRRLTDVAPGAIASAAAEFVAAGDFLYFRATTPARGTELWALPRSALVP